MKEHFDTVKDIDTLASTVFAPYEIKEECIDKIKELNVVNLISEFKKRLETLEPFDKDSVLALIKEVGKALQIKGRNLYFPLRLAVTMQEEGIEVHEYIYFIGKEETLSRLQKVLEVLNA
ncbi:MAG: hypothetical protein KBI30_04320 [Candidatus Atribacteria bacterium]|nr:hypothetical protein [Candidatus Atribacteria bacterium]